VPLLTGMNADEGSAFGGYGKAPPRFREQARTPVRRSVRGVPDGVRAGRRRRRPRAGAQRPRRRARVAAALRRSRAAKTPPTVLLRPRDPVAEHPEYGAFHTGEVPVRVRQPGAAEAPVDRRSIAAGRRDCRRTGCALPRTAIPTARACRRGPPSPRRARSDGARRATRPRTLPPPSDAALLRESQQLDSGAILASSSRLALASRGRGARTAPRSTRNCARRATTRRWIARPPVRRCAR
jgi:hypothetical protein